MDFLNEPAATAKGIGRQQAAVVEGEGGAAAQQQLEATRREVAVAEGRARKAGAGRRELHGRVEQLQAQLDEARDRQAAAEEEATEAAGQREVLLADHASAAAVHERTIERLQGELAALRAAGQDGAGQLAAVRAQAQASADALERELGEARARAEEGERRQAAAEAARDELAAAAAGAQTDLSAMRAEYEDYKGRVAVVLETKERTIARMKGPVPEPDGADAGAEALHAAVAAAEAATEQLRRELAEQEQQHLDEAEQLEAQLRDLQAEVLEVRRGGTEAAREHAEAIERVRVENESQSRRLATALSELEAARGDAEGLRLQLTESRALAAASGDAGSRGKVRELTAQLLAKQSAVESLTRERSTLQAQLDAAARREQQQQQQQPPPPRSGATAVSIPDTFASVNTMIGPGAEGDAPFTARLRRAARGLDAASLEIGIFLKRNPSARLIALVYAIMLHAWVLLVLFAYSPEMHGADGDTIVHHPVHPDHME